MTMKNFENLRMNNFEYLMMMFLMTMSNFEELVIMSIDRGGI